MKAPAEPPVPGSRSFPPGFPLWPALAVPAVLLVLERLPAPPVLPDLLVPLVLARLLVPPVLPDRLIPPVLAARPLLPGLAARSPTPKP